MKNTKIMIATAVGAFLLLSALDIQACPTCYGLSEEYQAPFFSDEFYPDKSRQTKHDKVDDRGEKNEESSKATNASASE